MKITEKVAFNIASKASYVYILSGQKLIKNASLQSNSVTRQVNLGQKLMENAKLKNSNATFLSNFQTGRKVGASRFQLQLTRKAGKSGKKEEANGN